MTTAPNKNDVKTGNTPAVRYGPNNPHPLSTLKTELVWEENYGEYGNHRSVSARTVPHTTNCGGEEP